MTDVILIAVFLATGVFGYRALNRLDRFLRKHVVREDDTDEQDRRTAG